LNNNYSDATLMKEALCYDMFQFLGADASLYNYASFSVNGVYTGLYLALEPVEEDFALRNYGVGYGELYKPDSMEMGGPGKMKNFDQEEIQQMLNPEEKAADEGTTPEMESDANTHATDTMPDVPDGQNPFGGRMPPDGQMPQRGQMPPDNQDFQGGQMPENVQMPGDGQMPDRKDFDGKSPGEKGSGSGANLNYIDDSLDSYSTIWDGEVFRTTDQDHQRVVTALKAICSEDADLEMLQKYMDVDNVLKYMAVHTFVVNLDSLSGNMAHNYYLYEDEGMLNLIPWDYNLAFGGFQGGSASETINFAIDTPFSSGISTEDRQFFMALLENEDCLQQYHAYLRQLAENYVQNGRLETVVASIRSQIDQLAADDPTAFFTYEEYDAAADMLLEVIRLRTDSVLGQLDGTIPSTNEGQQQDSSSLIDASSIDLTVMGSMMGGGKGDQGGDREGRKDGGQDFGWSPSQDGSQNFNQDVSQDG
ncbi:MAG: CotH kinase family protein, partial [Anaerovoracaceae bacterium]